MITVLIGASVGLLVGAAAASWLRKGSYRIPSDTPRLSLAMTPVLAVIAALAGAWIAPGLDAKTAAVAIVFGAGAVVVGWIDVDVHRIPNRVLWVWAPLVLLTVVITWWGQWDRLTGCVLGALAGAGVFFVLALIASMGMGDVKLAGVAGLALGGFGWSVLGAGLLLTFAVGAVMALFALLGGASRRSHVPFGPAIVVGAFVALALV